MVILFSVGLSTAQGGLPAIGSTWSGSGTLSLNPGWQFVQEFTPNPCNGVSCTTPVNCSLVNCLVPITVGDVVVVTLISNAVNVTITGVTGAGTGWTNAGCQAFQSGVDNIDIEYTLAATTSVQALTATFSGTVTGAYLDIMEWRPPSGHSAVFDGCAHNTPASGATATGGAPTVTGTDAIMQFYGGLSTTPSAFNSWSGSYQGTLEGTGICTNCQSGSAPTVTLAASTTMNIVGIAFKTDAGSFTPPTPTFAIVAHSLPTLAAFKTCNPGCGALTITSTGTGHLLYMTEADTSGTPLTLSTVTGGGTWVIPGGLHKSGAGANWELNGAYVLSSSSGVTSVTPTLSGNTTTALFVIWEISRTSGSFTLDTSGCTLNAGSATFLPAGEPLTLANSNPHVTLQSIVASGGTDGASFYPFPFVEGVPNGTVLSQADAGASNAILLNDTVGQTPAWPYPGTTTTTSTAVCGASFQ